MNDKINKLYIIFDNNIIVSNKKLFNAVTGLDIVEQANVGSIADIERLFYTKNLGTYNLPEKVLWKFTNPLNGTEWYLGKNLIACKKKHYIDILGIMTGGTCIVKNIQVLNDFQFLLKGCSSIRMKSFIGYLSTPDKAFINGIERTDTVRLPIYI